MKLSSLIFMSLATAIPILVISLYLYLDELERYEKFPGYFHDLVNRSLMLPWDPDRETFRQRKRYQYCEPGSETNWFETKNYKDCFLVSGGWANQICGHARIGSSCGVLSIPITSYENEYFRARFIDALRNPCAIFDRQKNPVEKDPVAKYLIDHWRCKNSRHRRKRLKVYVRVFRWIVNDPNAPLASKTTKILFYWVIPVSGKPYIKTSNRLQSAIQ